MSGGGETYQGSRGWGGEVRQTVGPLQACSSPSRPRSSSDTLHSVLRADVARRQTEAAPHLRIIMYRSRDVLKQSKFLFLSLTLPGVFLAVEVDLEVGWVEIDDGRIGLEHERLPRHRKEFLTSGRKYTHQLLEWLELQSQGKTLVDVTSI